MSAAIADRLDARGSRRGEGEQRTGADQERPPRERDQHRGHDRDEAARLPFEQQQLDREHDRGERRAEDAGHAGGGAGDQQSLALGRAQGEQLREQRADRAAGHDDRPFGAERAAAADRHRRRQGLQQRHLQRQLALAEQDGLDRLGDAVAADLVRPEARHQPDDQPADHGNQQAPAAGRDWRSSPARR